MSKKKEVRFRVKGFIVFIIFLLMVVFLLMVNVFFVLNLFELIVWIVRYVKLIVINIKMNFVIVEDGIGGFFVYFYKVYF